MEQLLAHLVPGFLALDLDEAQQVVEQAAMAISCSGNSCNGNSCNGSTVILPNACENGKAHGGQFNIYDMLHFQHKTQEV